jgi:hypothetical protein
MQARSSISAATLLCGDTCFDTGEGNKIYRWSGSAWVAALLDYQALSIGVLSAITANLGTVTAGMLQNASGSAYFDLNNSRVVFNNGSVMKVQGLGFGSDSQFIEWTGPSQSSFTNCTEANALAYIKTDGSAYFGGNLSAGTLSNSIQTSDTSSTAQIVLGPYGTNGSSKVITLSYSREAAYVGTANPGTPSLAVAIQLYRTIGSGGESLVATLNGTASTTRWYEAETSEWNAEQFGSGSLTYTDSVSGTDDRIYRAVISNMTGALAGNPYLTQRIGIVSVEE